MSKIIIGFAAMAFCTGALALDCGPTPLVMTLTNQSSNQSELNANYVHSDVCLSMGRTTIAPNENGQFAVAYNGVYQLNNAFQYNVNYVCQSDQTKQCQFHVVNAYDSKQAHYVLSITAQGVCKQTSPNNYAIDCKS